MTSFLGKDYHYIIHSVVVTVLDNENLIFVCFEKMFTGSIYRRGARRWRKQYRVNGHIFEAKRFNRVSRWLFFFSFFFLKKF